MMATAAAAAFTATTADGDIYTTTAAAAAEAYDPRTTHILSFSNSLTYPPSRPAPFSTLPRSTPKARQQHEYELREAAKEEARLAKIRAMEQDAM